MSALTQNDCAEFIRVSMHVNDRQILFICMNQEEISAKVHRPEPLCYTDLSL